MPRAFHTPSDADKIVKLQAQMANLQKKHVREKTFIEEEAQLKGLRIDVDTLEELSRALDHDPENKNMQMLYGSIFAKAKKCGLEPVNTGAGFDPLLHESIKVRQIQGVANGTILEVLRTGWRFRDRLIKPALVVVNRPGDQNED